MLRGSVSGRSPNGHFPQGRRKFTGQTARDPRNRGRRPLGTPGPERRSIFADLLYQVRPLRGLFAQHLRKFRRRIGDRHRAEIRHVSLHRRISRYSPAQNGSLAILEQPLDPTRGIDHVQFRRPRHALPLRPRPHGGAGPAHRLHRAGRSAPRGRRHHEEARRRPGAAVHRGRWLRHARHRQPAVLPGQLRGRLRHRLQRHPRRSSAARSASPSRRCWWSGRRRSNTSTPRTSISRACCPRCTTPRPMPDASSPPGS